MKPCVRRAGLELPLVERAGLILTPKALIEFLVCTTGYVVTRDCCDLLFTETARFGISTHTQTIVLIP